MPTVFQQNDNQCSLFRGAIKDRDMCPLGNSESQSSGHMLSTCQTPRRFGTSSDTDGEKAFRSK